MKAGDLTYLVAFDPVLNLPDGSGGVETDWDMTRAVTVRAHFRYLRGGETVQAARLVGRQPIVVTIRNSAAARAISEGWRMRDVNKGQLISGPAWDGPLCNVRAAPVPTDDRRWLEILVEGGVAV